MVSRDARRSRPRTAPLRQLSDGRGGRDVSQAKRIGVLERQVEQLQGVCAVLLDGLIVSFQAMDPTGQGTTRDVLERIEALKEGGEHG